MLLGRAFGPLWERRGANGEPTLPGFSPFLNFPPSGQGNRVLIGIAQIKLIPPTM